MNSENAIFVVVTDCFVMNLLPYINDKITKITRFLKQKVKNNITV